MKSVGLLRWQVRGLLSGSSLSFASGRAVRFGAKSSVWIVVIAVVYAITLVLIPDLRRPELVFVVAMGFLCELIDGALGMGYGTILTATLLLVGFTPGEVVPVLLLAELATGFASAFFHHEVRNVDLRWKGQHLSRALLLTAGGLIGVPIGIYIAVTLSQQSVKTMVGVILLLGGAGVIIITRKSAIVHRWWKSLVLAIVASFNKAVSGGSYGPLITSGQLLTGTPGRAAVAITSFAEGFTSLIAVVGYFIAGGTVDPLMLIPLLVGSLLSSPLAALAVSKTPERLLKYLLGAATTLMGGVLVYRGLLA